MTGTQVRRSALSGGTELVCGSGKALPGLITSMHHSDVPSSFEDSSGDPSRRPHMQPFLQMFPQTFHLQLAFEDLFAEKKSRIFEEFFISSNNFKENCRMIFSSFFLLAFHFRFLYRLAEDESPNPSFPIYCS